MHEQPSRRSYRRHETIRPTRLKPWGQDRWIQLSMIDWSAAGASLSGPTETVPLGPAILEISARHGDDDIRLACDVIWREKDKVGLRLRGPVGH